MVDVLNTIMPETKPLTNAIFKLDDSIINGMNWVIDKTENGAKGSSNLLNDCTATSREDPKTMIKEMLNKNNSYVGMTSDTINRPEKVVTFKGNSKPSYQSLL